MAISGTSGLTQIPPGGNPTANPITVGTGREYTPPTYTGNDIGNVQMYGQFQDTATGINDAWARANAQWQQDKQKYNAVQGYNPNRASGWNFDPLSGHSMMDQQYAGTIADSDAANRNRGFTTGAIGERVSGLAARQQLAGKMAAEAGMLQWKTGFANQSDMFDRQGLGINTDRNDALQANRVGFNDWLIQNGLFDVNKQHLEQSDVTQRLNTIARAWKAKFGSTANENAHGLTFQEWIDKLGNTLYDPNAHYGAAGRSF